MAQSNIEIADVDDAGVSQSPFLRPTKHAYEQLLPEIMAVPESEYITVNIDVATAITTVTGALPEIAALRPAIEAEWRHFNFAQFDKLELYTLALIHAHARYRVTTAPAGNVAELGNELNTLRDQLLANALALASVGLMDRRRFSSVKQVPGYRPLAMDVLGLCELFEDQWSKIQGKTAFTQDDLNRAGHLAQDLLTAVGLREQAPAVQSEAITIRQKAFSLFMRAYENARRAVTYLKPELAEDIAPSLYAGRAPRRRDEPEAASEAPPADAASTPGATPPSPAPGIVIDNRAGLPIDHPISN